MNNFREDNVENKIPFPVETKTSVISSGFKVLLMGLLVNTVNIEDSHANIPEQDIAPIIRIYNQENQDINKNKNIVLSTIIQKLQIEIANIYFQIERGKKIIFDIKESIKKAENFIKNGESYKIMSEKEKQTLFDTIEQNKNSELSVNKTLNRLIIEADDLEQQLSEWKNKEITE